VNGESSLTQELRWWDSDCPSPGAAMVKEAQIIEESPDFKLRCDLNLASMRMVEGAPIPALHAYSGRFGVGMLSALNADPVIFNALRAVVMAATNQIAKGRPQPRATTTGGNQMAQNRASGLTSFCKAIRMANRADELYPKAWFLCLGADVSAVHYFESNGRILLEPVFANELIFNPNESLFGTPRTWRRRRFLDKQIVMATWGKRKPTLRDAITNAKTIDLTELGLPSDMLCVYEAWRMPSLPGEKDGMHLAAIATENGTMLDDGLLFNDPWERPRPPLELITWEPAAVGPYGRSLASQLAPLQLSLNKNLYKAEQNLRMVAVPRVFLKTGGNVSTGTLGNMPGDVIRGTEVPQFLVPQAIGPEMLKYIADTVTRMYQIAGVNEQIAQGQKPPGLNSSIALQTHTDLVAARQALAQERYEALVCRGDEQIIWLAEAMHKRGVKLGVIANDGDALEKIEYKDVRLDEGEYIIEIQPESPLPQTAAGKRDYAIQLAGSSSPMLQSRAAEMLDALDPESELMTATAVQRAIDGDLEQIMNEGKYAPPEPYFGAAALKEGVQRAQAMFAIGRQNKVPQKNLDLLAQWMDDATAAANPASAVAAAPQAMAPLAIAPTPVAAAPMPTERLLGQAGAS
jgi:hypothetical protein